MKTLDIIKTHAETLYGHGLVSPEVEETLDELYTMCWDCLKEVINDHEEECGKKLYVVVARIGRWDGTHDGGKVIYGLWNAIQDMRNDMDDFEIHYDGFQLKATGIHHDGQNTFMIRELTEEGVRFYEKNKDALSPRELHNKLFYSRHKSKQTRFLYNCYGIQ